MPESITINLELTRLMDSMTDRKLKRYSPLFSLKQEKQYRDFSHSKVTIEPEQTHVIAGTKNFLFLQSDSMFETVFFTGTVESRIFLSSGDEYEDIEVTNNNEFPIQVDIVTMTFAVVEESEETEPEEIEEP